VEGGWCRERILCLQGAISVQIAGKKSAAQQILS
jgi:hypothetical protein